MQPRTILVPIIFTMQIDASTFKTQDLFVDKKVTVKIGAQKWEAYVLPADHEQIGKTAVQLYAIGNHRHHGLPLVWNGEQTYDRARPFTLLIPPDNLPKISQMILDVNFKSKNEYYYCDDELSHHNVKLDFKISDIHNSDVNAESKAAEVNISIGVAGNEPKVTATLKSINLKNRYQQFADNDKGTAKQFVLAELMQFKMTLFNSNGMSFSGVGENSAEEKAATKFVAELEKKRSNLPKTLLLFAKSRARHTCHSLEYSTKRSEHKRLLSKLAAQPIFNHEMLKSFRELLSQADYPAALREICALADKDGVIDLIEILMQAHDACDLDIGFNELSFDGKAPFDIIDDVVLSRDQKYRLLAMFGMKEAIWAEYSEFTLRS